MGVTRLFGAVFGWLVGLALTASALTASAQGIDCTKARAPVERAICASPQVLLQDQAMARAFAAALARQPDHAADLRHAQGQWLRERNTTCAQSAEPHQVETCLLRAYSQRLAALAPATEPAATSPPVTSVAATATEGVAAPVPPSVTIPPAAASLEQTRLPSSAHMQTFLHVTTAGRFSITAQSATGTALQLIDMLTGPSDTAGQPGQTDGRLDLLLDVGIYKLRAFAAPTATGDATLAVTPFLDAAPAEGAPVHGQRDTDLADRQQRRFWLSVTEGETIRLEAAGRALGDLVLWRNGTDLVSIPATRRQTEPTAGHPLTDIVLQGKLEPGVYQAVAYGAKPLPWADGNIGSPFHLRTGASEALNAGWISGHIGSFGSEIYRVGLASSALRLDLPTSAPVELVVSGSKGVHTTTIARNQREPIARLSWPVAEAGDHLVEIRGGEGQAFQLRALSGVVADSFLHNGTYWLSIDSFGLGGDEAPANYLLLRRAGTAPPERLGGSLPRVGPAAPWRAKFNLRGPIALPFEVIAGGPIAVHLEGVAPQVDIAPFGAPFPPRANGATPGIWDLAAGLYVLRLQPVGNAIGILDLTIGAPGATVASPQAAPPADPAWPIGLTNLSGNGRLEVFSTKAEPGHVGLLARPAPVDLADGPLAVTLHAGEGIDVPVRLPSDGNLIATELGTGPVAASFEGVPGATAGRIGTAHLPAGDHIRTVALTWQKPTIPPPPVPLPASLQPMEPLAADTQHFLDLKNGDKRSFALNVPSGGLYRVETTGRLRTSGAIGTAFVPDLAQETANGTGQNMLIQRFLRAGAYRLLVGAIDSTGHLGIQARPAAVNFGATLRPDGSTRARMAADAGVIFPIEISLAGTYHFELLSLAQGLTARLEDDEGWPMRAAGDLSDFEQDLAPGHYRLLVQPVGVAARVIARLKQMLPPPAPEGHGPFPLAFDTPQRATWREPPGRDDPRAPDRWDFALAGPAQINLAIGDGMVAELHRDGVDAPLARFTHATPFSASLPAGQFRVLATSLGRNDRLDYTISLTSKDLQPDTPRQVSLPANIPFAIDAERVVSLTSFGRVPVRGVLRRADGHLVERFGDRGDDWNIGLSRRLPAGAYRLQLDAAIPPKGQAVHPNDTSAPPEPDQVASTTDTDENEAADASMNEPAEAPDTAQPDTSQSTASADDNEASDNEKPKQVVELRLTLPAERTPVPADAAGTNLAGSAVHVLDLPELADQSLILAAATSSAELALALEQRGADGQWHILTTRQGIAPVVGAVGTSPATAWRALVWAIDGGDATIRFATRVLSGDPQSPGVLKPMDVALDTVPHALAATLIAVPGGAPLATPGNASSLLVASPGRPLTAPEGALILPQGERIWVVSQKAAGNLTLTPVKAPKNGDGLSIALPPAGAALLPGSPLATGFTRVWRADSGLGQPGLESGRRMGVATGSALALATGDHVRIFSAGGADALRLRVAALDLQTLPSRDQQTPLAEALPGGSALPLRLPSGPHRVDFALAAGTAAIADWRSADAVTIWTGSVPVSRSISGDFTDILLVNTGTQPAPVAFAWTQTESQPVLAAGMAFKRFFGAAGSLDIPVGDNGRLLVAGGEATLINQAGQVTEGRDLTLNGPGRAVIRHGPGLVAAWVETADLSPWPKPKPQAVILPQRLPMHDAVMALAFTAESQMLLHIRSTAPAILRLGNEPPAMFGQGIEMNRVLAAGPAQLLVISPHDGPLAGTLELSAEPIQPAHEGIGPMVALAPGGAAAFGFEVSRAGPVGVGVRAEPDLVSVRLLNAAGTLLGEGVAQLQNLTSGRYVLEAQIPPDSVTTQLRPTIVGIARHPNGPPPDVVNQYLALAGRAPLPK